MDAVGFFTAVFFAHPHIPRQSLRAETGFSGSGTPGIEVSENAGSSRLGKPLKGSE